MRKPLVVGNWKMNGTRGQVDVLLAGIKAQAASSAVDVVVLPSFVHLAQAAAVLADSPIQWGAQDLYTETAGAFTGEISGSMLKDLGCRYVLVGHSERRHVLKESNSLVAEKFAAAIKSGLQPILCLGETLKERELDATEFVIREQLTEVIDTAGIKDFEQAVIAYEPVWAIGTGHTATPEQAEKAHVFIRQVLAEYDKNIAKNITLLYGGSVKASNAKSLFAMENIDGGLIGGASLAVEDFAAICKAAG